MSHYHFIAWVSKVSFIISGSAWPCNFALPLCCQQPSSCIWCVRLVCCVCCIRYAAFSYYSWCCSLWCCCLMSLSTNNLMSSRVGKPMDTWSTTSPSMLWTMSSSLLSWKPLYLYFWEANEHLWYLETWQHSKQEIFQVKTKMNMRTDLQHTWVNDHEGCAISAGRSGDRLPRLHKAQSGLLGD